MQLLTYSYSFTVMNKANAIPTLHFMGKDKEFNAVTNKQTKKEFNAVTQNFRWC